MLELDLADERSLCFAQEVHGYSKSALSSAVYGSLGQDVLKPRDKIHVSSPMNLLIFKLGRNFNMADWSQHPFL